MKQWFIWYRVEPTYDDKFRSYTRFGDAINFMKKLAESGKDVAINQINGPDDFVWTNRITGEEFVVCDHDYSELPDWLK